MKEKEIYTYIAEHCPYCALCGSSWRLHIHHILYRSEGGPTTLWNLIRLCENCHIKVHSNKRIWQPRLQKILREIIIYECHYDQNFIEEILQTTIK